MIIMKSLLPLVLVLNYLAGTHAGASAAAAAAGSLTLTEASPQRLRGRYSRARGRAERGAGGGEIQDAAEEEGEEVGIKFNVVASKSGGYRSLAITTLKGVPVLATTKQDQDHGADAPLGISLFQHRFIVSKEAMLQDDENSMKRTRQKEYVVPNHLHGYFRASIKHPKVFDSLRKHLDKDAANETRSAAIGELLASEEAELVVHAARALGDRGVTGVESPAAMLFYVLAMRIHNLLDEKNPGMEEEEEEEEEGRARREVWNLEDNSWQFCQNSRHSCPVGNCPRGPECIGLCGRFCKCWKWVCGNCCVNRICLDHDKVCSRKGLISWCCLGIMWTVVNNPTMQCTSPYTCPDQE